MSHEFAHEPAPVEKARSLATMRLIAGGLLVLMASIFVLALSRQDQAPVWGYVRAFAEAALVGGLADWFAVTAIFRRPLGLPIPHTAVIPRSKERIAQALGEFVAVNFLAPDVIGARLSNQDLASALGRQLADPATARRVSDGIMDALPAIVDLLDDEVVSEFMRRQLTEFSRDERLSSALGRGIKLLTEHGRHQPVLDAALAEGWRALEEHEPAIRAQVRARTSWVWRIISLDARASDALIGAIEDTLHQVAEQPDHPARQRITALLQKFSEDLQHSPELRAQMERMIGDILAHPSVATYLAEVWQAMKQSLSDVETQMAARTTLAAGIERFGAALLEDQAVVETLNRRLRALLTEIAGRHNRDVGALISETIRSWDTATVVEKLEQNVGADLQYIRINGTIIGGLIGLAIHQTTLWLK
ncbi:DUF445 domain-containing protein [Vitreimonas flagellata]|uniref:DUF445 domain-containing protein n=1 Tax=Vitreimonas flagellata TaxID=2560861 RepID=UPI0010756D59|nr:DUF445 domain-containing protein [Vitreimonas flagellata]